MCGFMDVTDTGIVARTCPHTVCLHIVYQLAAPSLPLSPLCPLPLCFTVPCQVINLPLTNLSADARFYHSVIVLVALPFLHPSVDQQAGWRWSCLHILSGYHPPPSSCRVHRLHPVIPMYEMRTSWRVVVHITDWQRFVGG